MKKTRAGFITIAAAVLLLMTEAPSRVLAHCDSIDGPVIQDAKRALQSRDVTPVLKWVRPVDEREVVTAFELASSTRGENDAVQEIADHYFFETLVRVHRMSEGEGFTGLKPAGSVEPVIAATDRALAEGSIDELADETAEAVRDAIKARFDTAYHRKQVAEDSVEQGREYVESYVELTHFVKGIHYTVTHGASHKHLGDE